MLCYLQVMESLHLSGVLHALKYIKTISVCLDLNAIVLKAKQENAVERTIILGAVYMIPE